MDSIGAAGSGHWPALKSLCLAVCRFIIFDCLSDLTETTLDQHQNQQRHTGRRKIHRFYRSAAGGGVAPQALCPAERLKVKLWTKGFCMVFKSRHRQPKNQPRCHEASCPGGGPPPTEKSCFCRPSDNFYFPLHSAMDTRPNHRLDILKSRPPYSCANRLSPRTGKCTRPRPRRKTS